MRWRPIRNLMLSRIASRHFCATLVEENSLPSREFAMPLDSQRLALKIRGFDISAKRWGWAEMERVLVTGIPRSGTTLVTAMINDLDRSLCLSEPSRHVEWLETSFSRREYADRVIGDFDSVHAEIKRNGKVFDRRSPDGASFLSSPARVFPSWQSCATRWMSFSPGDL